MGEVGYARVVFDALVVARHCLVNTTGSGIDHASLSLVGAGCKPRAVWSVCFSWRLQ